MLLALLFFGIIPIVLRFLLNADKYKYLDILFWIMAVFTFFYSSFMDTGHPHIPQVAFLITGVGIIFINTIIYLLISTFVLPKE